MSARIYDIAGIGYGIQISAALRDIAAGIDYGTDPLLELHVLHGVATRLKDKNKHT